MLNFCSISHHHCCRTPGGDAALVTVHPHSVIWEVTKDLNKVLLHRLLNKWLRHCLPELGSRPHTNDAAEGGFDVPK